MQTGIQHRLSWLCSKSQRKTEKYAEITWQNVTKKENEMAKGEHIQRGYNREGQTSNSAMKEETKMKEWIL